MSAAATPKVLDIIRTASQDCRALDNTMAANELLEAAGMVRELLQAAKAVAFSNGFDAAYPDKLEALRAAIAKATGSTT
jgi:hypothetical protein